MNKVCEPNDEVPEYVSLPILTSERSPTQDNLTRH